MAAETDREDRMLLAEARAGNTRAFEALVSAHFGLAYSIALAHLRSRETAEDLAQEVLLRAYLFLPQFRADTRFANWIARTTRNLAIDWQRRKQHSSRLLPHVPMGEMHMDLPDLNTSTPRDLVSQAQQQEMVWKSLEKLPADQREVVLLHYMEELNVSEIADRFGGHRSTVQRKLGQALRGMRGMMEPLIRETVDTMRPPKAATAKSAAIIAAAAVLSVEAKGALAAQAAASAVHAATSWSLAVKIASGAALACVAVLSYVVATKPAQPVPAAETPSGLDAYPLFQRAFAPNVGADQRRAEMAELRKCTHFTYPGGEAALAKVTEAEQRAIVRGRKAAFGPPNAMISCQESAHWAEVESIFSLLRGEPDQAFEELAAYEQLGQLMAQSNTVITRLMGSAVAQLATSGLQIVVLNGCQSADDYERFRKQLEVLKQYVCPTTLAELCKAIGADPNKMPVAIPNLQEAVTRQNRAVARFELLRVATAARHCLTATGHYPRNPAEFTLFTGRLPEDPFSPTRSSLSFQEDPASGDAMCYSVGPDKADGGGRVDYDPTNGTLSVGDEVLRVPRKRQYPFPVGGVHATSAADLARQFPNGLPADPFDKWSRPTLGVTDTQPVRVYSCGPDRWTKAIPTVQYDPTNGAVSAGGLFMEIPR